MLATADGRFLTVPDLCLRSVDVFAVSGVSVMLSSEQFAAQRIAASATDYEEIEDTQFVLGEGPGIDATKTRSLFFCGFLGSFENIWPNYVPVALGFGVVALIVRPLTVGATNLGAVTLYWKERPAERDALIQACLFGELVTTALLSQSDGYSDQNVVTHTEEAFWGQEAWVESSVIHQATGMVGAQIGCSMEDALLRIRAHAFSTGRTIKSVAQDIVRRKLRFDSELS